MRFQFELAAKHDRHEDVRHQASRVEDRHGDGHDARLVVAIIASPAAFRGGLDVAPIVFDLPSFRHALADLGPMDDGALSADARLRAFLMVLKYCRHSNLPAHIG